MLPVHFSVCWSSPLSYIFALYQGFSCSLKFSAEVSREWHAKAVCLEYTNKKPQTSLTVDGVGTEMQMSATNRIKLSATIPSINPPLIYIRDIFY